MKLQLNWSYRSQLFTILNETFFYNLKSYSQTQAFFWIVVLSLAGALNIFNTGCDNTTPDSISPMILTVGKGSGLNGDGSGPPPVELNTTDNFTLLAQSAISTERPSEIEGNVGLYSAKSNFMTGFFLSPPLDTFSTSQQISGRFYAFDYSSPTPALLSAAAEDMKIASRDAASREPDHVDISGGLLEDLSLPPATYYWSSNVVVNSNLNLLGGPHDVWIFQISGNLMLNSKTRVLLSDGIQSGNIYWQITGHTVLEENTHFEGVLLADKSINLKSQASVKGLLFSGTSIILDRNKIIKPN